MVRARVRELYNSTGHDRYSVMSGIMEVGRVGVLFIMFKSS